MGSGTLREDYVPWDIARRVTLHFASLGRIGSYHEGYDFMTSLFVVFLFV